MLGMKQGKDAFILSLPPCAAVPPSAAVPSSYSMPYSLRALIHRSIPEQSHTIPKLLPLLASTHTAPLMQRSTKLLRDRLIHCPQEHHHEMLTAQPAGAVRTVYIPYCADGSSVPFFERLRRAHNGAPSVQKFLLESAERTHRGQSMHSVAPSARGSAGSLAGSGAAAACAGCTGRAPMARARRPCSTPRSAAGGP